MSRKDTGTCLSKRSKQTYGLASGVRFCEDAAESAHIGLGSNWRVMHQMLHQLMCEEWSKRGALGAHPVKNGNGWHQRVCAYKGPPLQGGGTNAGFVVDYAER